MPEENRKPPILLVIEDNQADVLLLEEALGEVELKLDLQVAKDGDEALRYLRRLPPFAEAARPDLILLDMNLPRTNGFEVLEEIKQDPALKMIPVVVLSTSSAVIDVNRSYLLQANCFITKPNNLDAYMGVIASIASFWLATVSLPQPEGYWKG